MEKEFIPYEESLALKELGYLGSVNAPLYQQAFRWFREKYNLYPSINICHDLWMCLIKSTVSNQEHISGYIVYAINKGYPTFKTYEEAELECLKKLIEIVKEQK